MFLCQDNEKAAEIELENKEEEKIVLATARKSSIFEHDTT